MYDKDVDILYLLFKEDQSHEVMEADPDIYRELGKGEISHIHSHQKLHFRRKPFQTFQEAPTPQPLIKHETIK
ncbi:MAG: DUF2283 domain-containing protein [Candidatus Bathyarchaeia archaeon]